MIKYTTLLVLSLTAVIAQKAIYPTTLNQASVCMDCTAEEYHCFLFDINGDNQKCVLESNGSTAIDLCTSVNNFFNVKDGVYTIKKDLAISEKCKMLMYLPLPGNSTIEPVCEPSDTVNVRICLNHISSDNGSSSLDSNASNSDATPSINLTNFVSGSYSLTSLPFLLLAMITATMLLLI